MLSHKYKCIFIHIPKTGGESIVTLFDDIDSSVPKHANALQIRDYLGKEKWDEYFKFTIVRNPWDQVVSMYSHLRKPLYQPEKIRKKYGKEILNPVNACKVACSTSFSAYCTAVFKQKQAQTEETRNPWPVYHFAPFVDWISDETGELLVNYIGRFESLQDEISTILKRIGMAKKELPLINRSRHKHYSKYYDSKTKEIIEKHYHKDVQTFSYGFEDKKNKSEELLLTIKNKLRFI